MLRGRIASLKGIPAETYVIGSGGWHGYCAAIAGLPMRRTFRKIRPCPKANGGRTDYGGKPLVSFSAEEAGELQLDVGDEITVNVLGRNITAEIASLRNVEWESLAINFVMVFSPNTFAGAPHSHLATLTLDDQLQIECS